MYDVGEIRGQYPALADGRAWLDGAAGTQVPQVVIDAVADTYRAGVSNQGGPYESSRRASSIVGAARQAVADLVGAADPAGVVFGPNMTTATYRFAATLAAGWQAGDEIVVTQLDHDANVRPWVQAAEKMGAVVRTATVDPETGALPTTNVTGLIGERTRLVAVTAASNLLGVLPDVSAISARAREVGALTYVDGVHHCPHEPVSVTELGADFYATSVYKWSGPHIGCVVADPAVLEGLTPDKLVPSPDTVPERFETGTAPFASLAGVTAAVEHLADLDKEAAGSRRERLALSRRSAAEHEQNLAARMIDGLAALDGVHRYGPSAGQRTPTVLFGVHNRTPAEIAAKLAESGVNVSHGHSYAWEAVHALGLGASGAVRASLAHYSDESDVQRLLDAVADLV